MKLNELDWIGKTVLIRGNHPHKNEVGTIIKFENVAHTRAALIECEQSGVSFYVFEVSEMKLIDDD